MSAVSTTNVQYYSLPAHSAVGSSISAAEKAAAKASTSADAGKSVPYGAFHIIAEPKSGQRTDRLDLVGVDSS